MKRASRQHRVYPALVLVAALLAALFGGKPLLPEARTDGDCVHFIDVGQGDCALLQLGQNAVLIDAGPTSAADNVVSYLKQQGVTRLAAVIATHPHEDHIGGMGAVLEAFPVDTFYMPAAQANTSSFSSLLDGLDAQGLTPVVPSPGDTISIGGAELLFLSPEPAQQFENINNYSLVARIDTGGTRLLFAGDAENEIEETLVQRGADLRCDIYKVSHHGSDTSSSPAFLQAAQPETAVISCGKENAYGHPHPAVLARLKDAGIQTIHITAGSGTIVLPLEPPAQSAPKENVA